MKKVAAALIAALLIAIAVAAIVRGRKQGRVSPGAPIVVISIDTLRADRLPLYGYAAGRTPHLDALARESILFERAYSHAPLTLPAHASMLTGELPFTHGVRDNAGFSIASGARMIQHDLRDQGYRTGAAVSAYVLRSQTGISSGFDFFDDRLPPVSSDRAVGRVQRDGMQSLEAAARWMDSAAGDRFFLFLHLYEPHTPYAPPARFTAADPYDGEVSYADAIVGAFIERLKSRGVYDTATIVVVADHGEGLGDHVEQEHGLFVYDETIRVPLLIKLPDGVHGGRRVSAPVQHVDLRPTLVDLAGGAVPRTAGRSLRPLLENTGTVPSRGIYSEALYPRYHFGWSELLALTDDRFRYIKAPREELYDLARDPKERTDLTRARPQVTTAMRQALDEMSSGAEVQRPSDVSPQDRERLAALGYVGTGRQTDPATPGSHLPDPKDKVHVLERYRRAVELSGRGEVARALALFQGLLKEDPGMTDVWAQYGQLLVVAGDLEGAFAAYREILKRVPTDSGTLIAAASVLMQLGRLDEARRHAELAIADAPAGAHERLARIAIAARDAAAARRHAEEAQKADPTLPMADYVEGVLLQRDERFAEALPHLLKAADKMQTRTVQIEDLHYFIGDTLARLERYAEAEPHFLEEIAMSPHHSRARAGLAMLYRAMGRDQASDATIDEMLRVAPSAESFRLAADLWAMFGQPQRAARTRAEASKRFPERQVARP